MSFSKNIGYMYAYNNGIRNKNVGFVKAEVRNDMLKININMKEAYFDGGNCFDVHVFFRRNGKICGIYLGSMNINEGCGEFHEFSRLYSQWACCYPGAGTFYICCNEYGDES